MTDFDLELLSSYLDDALTAEERRTLELRLAQDMTLRAELDRLRETRALLRALPMLRAPRDFALTPAMIAPKQANILYSPWLSSLSAAAAAVLLVLGIVLLGQSQSVPSVQSPVVAALPTMAAGLPTSTQALAQAMDALASPTEEAANTLMEARTGDETPLASAAADTVAGAAMPAAPEVFAQVTATVEGMDAAALEMSPMSSPAAGAAAGAMLVNETIAETRQQDLLPFVLLLAGAAFLLLAVLTTVLRRSVR
jgi:anti-sigma factor RsiW